MAQTMCYTMQNKIVNIYFRKYPRFYSTASLPRERKKFSRAVECLNMKSEYSWGCLMI